VMFAHLIGCWWSGGLIHAFPTLEPVARRRQ
jgi:hypothetical protein